ncbi:uncharacterized protein LOC106359158 [Brassica napus]|uniref:uncharacterized protein LOC106359158 n=1 Tax=Brassica napus TaxID=3708 RepID=UPI00207A2475|nr:uncharacterized protein LOC106359158 [Brassica napus]
MGEGTLHTEEEPYQENYPNVMEGVLEDVMEAPNEEQYGDGVFQAFEAANEPLYEGCVEGISQLYLASRLMKVKIDHNLPESCLDEISQTFRDVLPQPNKAPESYYEMKKLTKALGLPVLKIDVCEDNCMLFWKEDKDLVVCRFCGKDRYHQNHGKGKKRPKQRMFYMPITERLKRLYQLEETAAQMRWHAEHESPEGEMHHPSDGAAWKHFNKVYPDFTEESRNIYLGLATDGFNPVGMSGEAHSVWPVIVTPYNLPLGMCMKREYFFLSVLVPGPRHPKKSIDIYLQPLIEELQSLWSHGAETYDISRKETFTMRAALMWTINDFPAYGMMSGWMTHGRLAFPYCLDDTKSFWLKHGRKHSWFDCHRMFLPKEHPYRRNVQAFRKGKTISDDPPPWLTGEEIRYERINNIVGLKKTVECGGNGHEKPGSNIEGYGKDHNWVKKSIFWELPYWENLLLRHNVDFMHVEKNFFDNLINTVLNVPGKTKDNAKSRMDLPDLCRRQELHIKDDGKMPVPIFRLSKEEKKEFLRWLKEDIKFPDGYASKFSRCIDETNSKLSGLKSHDCHVIMQRLLPFAFKELLPKNVRIAISEIALFFRDISAKVLKEEDVAILKENIAVKLCNLEKIFPPSFFDVMEHLVMHLPDEAALGGPVQYRWMYPFERYMYHLKKKVRNKAHIAGSIISQCLTEEISRASAHHFGNPEVPATVLQPGDIRFTYHDPDVPNMFYHESRVSEKMEQRHLTDDDYNVLQTFLMLICPAFEPYERMFEEFMMDNNPNICGDDLQIAKDNHYAEWVKNYVNEASKIYQFPLWMLDFVQGPKQNYKAWPIYFSRGYCFHTHSHGQDKRTQHYGVQVRGTTDTDYYGLIEEIMMVEYSGSVGLKSMVFKCKWFDTIVGRGIRKHKSGIVDVSPRWQYEKYDPFILSGNCDQVCFIPYPRVRGTSANDWWACTKVVPRGVRETSEDALTALQDDTHDQVVAPSEMLRFETYVVEDDSDYDSTPVVPPNDEYVSEDELEPACTDSDSGSDSSS